MADSSRPSTVDSLRTSLLGGFSNSLVISSLHQSVLQEKRREFNELVKKQKKQYENEAKEYLELHNLKKNTEDEDYRKLRNEQQSNLTKLQDNCQERLNQLFHKFQREWMMDPVQADDSSISNYNGPENGAYIAKAVGRALELGLTEVCQHQPADPIEYLAMWLKSYSMKCQRERQTAVESIKLKLAEEEENLRLEVKRHIKIEASNLKKDEQRRKKQYLQRTKNTNDVHITANTEDQKGLRGKESGSSEKPKNISNEESTNISGDSFEQSDQEDCGSRASVLYTIEEQEADENQQL